MTRNPTTTPASIQAPAVADDIQALKAVLTAAPTAPTSGPWGVRSPDPDDNDFVIRPRFRGSDANTPKQAYFGYRPLATVHRDKRLSRAEALANANFIATCSPDRISRILARLDELEHALARAESSEMI